MPRVNRLYPMSDRLSTVGQLFMVGFKGAYPEPDLLDFLRRHHIGGVILFGDNCQDHLRLREALAEIRTLYPEHSPPFVAVDQEGGRVCRIKGSPGEYRAPTEYGSRRRPHAFVEDYARSAEYLAYLGVNLNLAPVADIFLNEANDCLRDRCFGTDPAQVSEFVARAVSVSHRHRLLCCLKHFPGLGAAAIDPHQSSAKVDCDLPTWLARERQPFEVGIQAGADMIMTTHVLVPALDNVIATGSARVVSLLRDDLGFNGPVITDELSMSGAATLGDIGERAITAIQAGHDIVLFGQELELTREAFAQVMAAVESGRIETPRLLEAAERVARIKLRMGNMVCY